MQMKQFMNYSQHPRKPQGNSITRKGHNLSSKNALNEDTFDSIRDESSQELTKGKKSK